MLNYKNIPIILKSRHFPGFVLLIISMLIGFVTFRDYGIAWDEPAQHAPAILSYNYIVHGSRELYSTPNDNHGAGFELLLVAIEKGLRLTNTRYIYLSRHLATHVVFLLSAFCLYLLAYRLFKNKYIASLAFIMLAFTPRLYAHSFFNSKDIPFLCFTLIALLIGHVAFEQNKPKYFLLLGLTIGYATSIRIMGTLFALGFIILLLRDIVTAHGKKEKTNRLYTNLLLLCSSFCLSLYACWPYLWAHPIGVFVDSFRVLAHYNLWEGSVLLCGQTFNSPHIPTSYFPTWFLISNPVLWLLLGFAGIVFISVDLMKKPKRFLTNTSTRNFLVYMFCFFAPIVAVIALKSVIYDDWRHLYFVYPPFILLALYFVNRVLPFLPKLTAAACGCQLVAIVWFMVQYHPFQQVYFNELVSHKNENLRHNYDLEYWGTSYKQALDYIIAHDNRALICVTNDLGPLETNFMLLNEHVRTRFVKNDTTPNYKITISRGNPNVDTNSNMVYRIKVLNSTIMCVYKLH